MPKAVAAQAFDKIEFTSDGTVAGSSMKVNGKEVKNLTYMNVTLYSDEYYKGVGVRYQVVDPNPKAGELLEARTFTLIPKPEPKADAAKAEASVGSAQVLETREPREHNFEAMRKLFEQIR